jgi:4'-phosphopantetheinyl transferase
LSKKEEFLCSRGILRIILSMYAAEDPQNLILSCSESGKPFLLDSVIEFNVSHSRDLLICGISSKQKIGLDIQEVYSISSMDRIILNHFSPAEIQYLQDLPSTEEYQEHFFAIWTAKEAYFKGVGDGIKETFNQVSFIPESADLRSYQLILPGSPTDQSEWTINTIEIAQGYIAALAYEGQMNKMRRYEFGPENFFRP